MPRFAANLTLLFNEYPFLDRFAAAAEAGFSGVEFLFPYAWDKQVLSRHLSDCGLEQVLFNLPPGDWEGGERGIACLPDRTDEFRAGVEQAIDYANALGCRRLNCLAGLLPDGMPPDLAERTLAANLGWAARRLAPEGITLMVEAINSRVDMPGFLIDTAPKALALMATIGEPNILLQFDLYHMQIMQGDLIRSLRAWRDKIGHIQFADNPGRHEPGTGEIGFAGIFQALDEMDYEGWVSAEYHPSDNTLASLRRWELLR